MRGQQLTRLGDGVRRPFDLFAQEFEIHRVHHSPRRGFDDEKRRTIDAELSGQHHAGRLRITFVGNEHPIDPHVLDLVYRLQTHFNAHEIRIISGYRTPKKNGTSNHGKGRAIDLVVWRGEIPITWFQAFNPFMIFAFTPVIIALWTWQGRRGAEPSTVAKMALGCLGVALANLIMVAAAWHAAGDEASWLWLLGYFMVLTVGELYLSPIGLSRSPPAASSRNSSSVRATPPPAPPSV